MRPRIDFIDVSLRDAHQCLWSTRMTTAMMMPILGTIDRAGYSILNVLGGAVFDVCVRFLQENPYARMRAICSHLRSTPADALTRGQSLYTFEIFPDDIVALNARHLKGCGIEWFTVYDALNDIRNLESSILAGREAGLRINAMLVYTISPVHTDAYYQDCCRELKALGVDHISVKDPTGLLTPERARTLFPALVAVADGTPLQLHSHCQSGLAPDVYAEAIRAGFAFFHTASEPLGNGASLPATEEIVERARLLGAGTSLDPAALAKIAAWFRWLCVREGKPMGEKARFDPALYQHQVPGGMISNLRSQLQTLGIEHRLPEILEETARVRADLGYPILVSPFAQYFVTQAVLNVMQGERYRTIPDEVLKYARGCYGRLAAPLAPAFLERAGLRDADFIATRAGADLAPWIPRLRAELGLDASDEDVLFAAFYPAALRQPMRNPLPTWELESTPFAELVRHLGAQRDVTRMRVRVGGVSVAIGS